MVRALLISSFLSAAACISYPDVSTIATDDDVTDASVSPDGSIERITIVERAVSDAGDSGAASYPKRDASTTSDDAGRGSDDGSKNGHGKAKGKGKGKGKGQED